MYYWLAQFSQMVMDPVIRLVHAMENYPLIVAILLGIIGAVAPCQLTANMSAITLYGNQSVQKGQNRMEITLFIVGKITAFSLLGLFAWLLGEAFEQTLLAFFPWMRKLIGPMIVVTGLVLIGALKMKWLGKLTSRIPLKFKSGKLGSFLLGVSFSLAFCPTMFVLFFVLLMPITVTSTYGFIFPAVFGIATALPLLVLYFFIWFFDAKRWMMKKTRVVGQFIQRVAGIILIMIGIFDTMTFWSI